MTRKHRTNSERHVGKARERLLKEITKLAGFRRPEVIIKPDPHLDAGAEALEGEYRIYAVDPCLGVPERHLGFLAFHFPASDVAVMGGEPYLVVLDMLLPLSYPEERILLIMRQIHEQAVKYEASIISGHTGRYSAVKEPVVSCTIVGRAKRLLVPKNVEKGDLIVVSGWVGGELLYALSNFKPELIERTFGEECVRSWRSFYEKMTVVDAALALSRAKLARAMKDGAEGGIVRALNDLSAASGLGFRINQEEVPIPEEVMVLSEEFNFDPLSASSSGVLIAVVRKGTEEESTRVLRSMGLRASVIGEMLGEGDGRYVLKGDELAPFPSEAEDPYSRLVS